MNSFLAVALPCRLLNLNADVVGDICGGLTGVRNIWILSSSFRVLASLG